MQDLIWRFFDIRGFQPHGFCLLWRPEIFLTHAVADGVIVLAYFSIPLALYRLGRARPDLGCTRMLHLYAAFIIACGVTHLLGIWTMWMPNYGAQALAKLVAAGVSAGVAVETWRLLPTVMSVPSPAQLEARNVMLAREIDERRAAEAKAETLVEELRRSNDELDTFAHAASHDLRAPLRIIGTAANWLESDLSPEARDEVRPTLVLMRSRIARMDRLLEDLLTHAKLGREDMSTRYVTGAALMEDVLDLVDLPEGFTVATDPALAAAIVPQVPTRNILLNLVSNAIKHHDRARGHVRVGLREFAGVQEFSVEDDGPGIPPRFHRKVFEVFQTLRPRDEVEGSGLGLSMVKKAVESSGGTLRLVSDGVRGTLFFFTLPRGPSGAAPLRPESGDQSGEEGGGAGDGEGDGGLPPAGSIFS